jgi:hypothetical protein
MDCHQLSKPHMEAPCALNIPSLVTDQRGTPRPSANPPPVEHCSALLKKHASIDVNDRVLNINFNLIRYLNKTNMFCRCFLSDEDELAHPNRILEEPNDKGYKFDKYG